MASNCLLTKSASAGERDAIFAQQLTRLEYGRSADDVQQTGVVHKVSPS